MRARSLSAASLILTLAVSAPAFAADSSYRQELDTLKERVRRLEDDKASIEAALAQERISEQEPEFVTRIKAVEFQALSMQKQARTVEALEGVSASAALSLVAQSANGGSTIDRSGESQLNYRADVSVNLPGGEIGNAEGNLFAHFRMGQGDGLTRILPTFSGVNATGFHVQGVREDDDASILLAQAWYQLDVPLPIGGFKSNSRQTLTVNVGKMDPFLFFDQNAIADDETTRFLGTAFVHNPLLDAGGDIGVDAFGFTPGLRIGYRNETQRPLSWGASLGVFGAGTGAVYVDTFDKPFAIAQLESTQRFFGGLEGNYRLYAWHNAQAVPYANESDASVETHAGWGISADQRVTESMTLFVRYGQELKGRVRFDRAATIGAQIDGSAWHRGADALGLAVGVLRTGADFRRDAPALDADGDGNADFGYQPTRSERVAEVYYRYRVNPQFELSPDIQFIQKPAADPDARDIVVFGLRAQFTF
jgi:hypothetical protein